MWSGKIVEAVRQHVPRQDRQAQRDREAPKPHHDEPIISWRPTFSGMAELTRREFLSVTALSALEGAGVSHSGDLTLCLCGDVMTGRGIDQILPFSSDPRLYESYVE